MLPGSRARILVVDDDVLIRRQIIDALLPGRFTVVTSASGADALSILAAERPFDLILADLQMPAMDGFELCRRIRADPKLAAIPVCFVTASARDEDKRTARQLGALAFLRKPVHAAKLLTFVQDIVAEGRDVEEELPPLIAGYIDPGRDALLPAILILDEGSLHAIETAGTGDAAPLAAVCAVCNRSYFLPDVVEDDRLFTTCERCISGLS